MTVIKVLDMHCEKCVEKITNMLTEAGINFTINLEEKTILIDGCDRNVEIAMEALEELGFTPEL